MRTPLVALSLLALLAPAAASAQSEAAAPLEDRPARKLNEVERGFYVSAEGGGLFLFGPQASSGSGFSTGRSFGLSIGTDLGESLGIGLLMLGNQVSTPSGFTSPLGMGGEFSSLTLGALARLALYKSADEAGFNRFFLFARGGGGLSLMGPEGFYEGNDVLVFGGAGIEYYTHLRHFSIGLNADFVYGATHLGPGLMISPTLRYTF